MKMKKIFIAIIIIFALSGCKGTDVSSSSLPIPNLAIEINNSIEKFEGNYYLEVKNDVSSINLANIISVDQSSYWNIYNDSSLQKENTNKFSTLDYGNNNFYIKVTACDNTFTVYSLNIYRLSLYTVTFDTQGGTTIKEQKVEENSLVTPVDNPVKSGQTFIKWNYDFSEPVKNNLTITAQWKTNDYSITLDTNGGTLDVYNIIPANYGNEIELPTPIKTGYTFECWLFENKPLGDNFVYEYENDITLVAQWKANTYEITYEPNGGEMTSFKQYVTFDSEYNLLPITKNGHSLTYKYNNEIISENGIWTIEEDVTISAEWSTNKYSIALDPNGGTLANNLVIPVLYGEEITLPSPNRDGYTFGGWYFDSESVNTTFEYKYETNVELKAKWIANSYKITYNIKDYYYDTYYENVVYGEEYSLFNMEKPGYSTVYLYNNKKLNTTGIWNIAQDIEIDVQFTPNEYEISMYYNSEEIDTEYILFDSEYCIKEYEISDGYFVKSWIYEDEVYEVGDSFIYSSEENTEMYANDIIHIGNDFSYKIIDKNYIGIIAYNGYNRNIVIPKYIQDENETYTVIEICDYAFRYCSSLTSITLPDSVTSIGDHAFYDCSSLTSITIPDSVTSIDDYAFAHCSKLTTILLPDSLLILGDYVFYDCKSLISITIPKNVIILGDGVLAGCLSLRSVNVDIENESFKSIDGVLFNYNCSSLLYYPIQKTASSYVIPNTVTSINDNAFYGCSSLTSITLPDSVRSIGDSAFYGCSGLTSITIPDSVTSIGNSTFRDCSSLTSIILPDNVRSIGGYAFYGCSSLTIYCEASIQPDGWAEDWNESGCPVIWGYVEE